jgi:hypothetical protein
MTEDVGVAITCIVCGCRKAPRRRSVPIDMANNLCDWGCPGYNEEPYPSQLWPGETKEEFGY